MKSCENYVNRLGNLLYHYTPRFIAYILNYSLLFK